MLLAARDAPRRENIHQRDLAAEVGRREAKFPSLNGWKAELRHRPAEQGRGNFMRVMAEKEPGSDSKADKS